MKALAYTLYVVTVLLISGFASANAATLDSYQAKSQVQTQYEMPVSISQVVLDGTAENLIIAGSLPNPCYAGPSAFLTQDQKNPTVLVIHLTSPVPTNACVSRVKYFDSKVELQLLVQASRLNLSKGTTYVLKVDGTDFEMQISGSALLI